MYKNSPSHPLHASAWSEALQQYTRQALMEVPFTPDGKLRLKHPTGGYAYIKAEDLLQGRFILYFVPGSTSIWCDDLEDLLQAGWALD